MTTTDEITPEQLSRLPKYAQDLIASLTRRVADRDARLAELTAGPEGSDTVANPHADLRQDGSKAQPLGDGTTVRFFLTLGDRRDVIDAHVIDRGRGRVLEIQAPGGAFGSLAVRPTSSNCVHIMLDERAHH